MTTVLNYTRKLLYEHDCVVLPDLGGFLAYFSHAYYSEHNALYHAPQKRVAFNEALKLEDGLLVHYLTVNENITREDAQKRVRDFVDEIKNGIRENGCYALEGIGLLETSTEGNLQFSAADEVNFYSDGFGYKSLKIKALHPTIEVNSTETEKDWTTTDRGIEKLEITGPRRRRSRIALYVGSVLLVGSALVGAFTQLPTESLKSSLNPFELITTIKTYLASDIKSNVDRILPVSDTRNTSKQIDSKEVIAVESSTNGTNSVKDPVINQPIVEAVPKTVIAASPQEKAPSISLKSDDDTNYMVIAGGFSKIENAKKLQIRLQRNGYESATILDANPADGKLIIVSAIGCENSHKAKSQIANVSRLSGADAYIVRK